MALIPLILVPSQDAPDHVAADPQVPDQRPDRPAFPGLHDYQSLFQIFPVLNDDSQRLLPIYSPAAFRNSFSATARLLTTRAHPALSLRSSSASN